jgi:hypothetical protein
LQKVELLIGISIYFSYHLALLSIDRKIHFLYLKKRDENNIKEQFDKKYKQSKSLNMFSHKVVELMTEIESKFNGLQLRVQRIHASKNDTVIKIINQTVKELTSSNYLVLLHGHGKLLAELRNTLLGSPVEYISDPYLVIIAENNIMTYSRPDMSDILPGLIRWYESTHDNNCIICNHDCCIDKCGYPDFLSCITCFTKICYDCFPSLVFDNKDGTKMCKCPKCRIVGVASDNVHIPPTIGKTMKMWSAIKECVQDKNIGFVIVKPSSTILVADIMRRKERKEQLKINSPHWKLALALMNEEGIIIGIGELPLHGRRVDQPDNSRFEVDPKGRAFLTMGDGNVMEIEKGWRYLCSVAI